MTIAEMIIYLRTRLMALRTAPDAEAAAELLTTFKMLTKAAFEAGDKELTALLVDLTDAARDVHMGKPLNGQVPTESAIRVAAALSNSKDAPNPVTTALLEDTQPIADETIQQAVREAATSPPPTAATKTPQERLEAIADHDWYTHEQIQHGTPRQMRAYTTLYDDLMLFLRLEDHQPMWVGAYPIDIDIDSSPLLMLCHPKTLKSFIQDTREHYGTQDKFKLVWRAVDGIPTIVVTFKINEFNVELFGQPRPVTEQATYINMVAQARLLAIGGDDARETIRRMVKGDAMTLEAAFAAYFKLQGEPQAALSEISRLPDGTLISRIRTPQG